MNFLKKLFGQGATPAGDGMDEHLVRLHIPLASDMPNPDAFARFTALEDVLENAARTAKAGELDGNEMGGGEYTIWLYGPEAGLLSKVVQEVLAKHDLPPGCTLFVRHGGTGQVDALEETIQLS